MKAQHKHNPLTILWAKCGSGCRQDAPRPADTMVVSRRRDWLALWFSGSCGGRREGLECHGPPRCLTATPPPPPPPPPVLPTLVDLVWPTAQWWMGTGGAWNQMTIPPPAPLANAPAAVVPSGPRTSRASQG